LEVQKWNLTVVLGAVLGGFLFAVYFLSNAFKRLLLSAKPFTDLKALGFQKCWSTILPPEIL